MSSARDVGYGVGGQNVAAVCIFDIYVSQISLFMFMSKFTGSSTYIPSTAPTLRGNSLIYRYVHAYAICIANPHAKHQNGAQVTYRLKNQFTNEVATNCVTRE